MSAWTLPIQFVQLIKSVRTQSAVLHATVNHSLSMMALVTVSTEMNVKKAFVQFQASRVSENFTHNYCTKIVSNC